MSDSVQMVAKILSYNTWLFGSALNKVTAEQASYRVSAQTNTFDRLAGHVAVGRIGLAGVLEIEVEQPAWGDFAEFDMGTQFEVGRKCPPLKEIEEAFNSVSKALLAGLPKVSVDVLNQASPLPIPGDNPTKGDLLSFLTMHETYHIGQLGMLKKSMGGKGIMAG